MQIMKRATDLMNAEDKAKFEAMQAEYRAMSTTPRRMNELYAAMVEMRERAILSLGATRK